MAPQKKKKRMAFRLTCGPEPRGVGIDAPGESTERAIKGAHRLTKAMYGETGAKNLEDRWPVCFNGKEYVKMFLFLKKENQMHVLRQLGRVKGNRYFTPFTYTITKDGTAPFPYGISLFMEAGLPLMRENLDKAAFAEFLKSAVTHLNCDMRVVLGDIRRENIVVVPATDETAGQRFQFIDFFGTMYTFQEQKHERSPDGYLFLADEVNLSFNTALVFHAEGEKTTYDPLIQAAGVKHMHLAALQTLMELVDGPQTPKSVVDFYFRNMVKSEDPEEVLKATVAAFCATVDMIVGRRKKRTLSPDDAAEGPEATKRRT